MPLRHCACSDQHRSLPRPLGQPGLSGIHLPHKHQGGASGGPGTIRGTRDAGEEQTRQKSLPPGNFSSVPGDNQPTNQKNRSACQRMRSAGERQSREEEEGGVCVPVGVCAGSVTHDRQRSEHSKAGTRRGVSGSEGTDGGSCRGRGAGLGMSRPWSGAARTE